MNRHATPFKSRLNEHRQTSRQIADKSSPIQCHESFYCWHLHVCTHAAAFWFYTRYTQTAYTPSPPLLHSKAMDDNQWWELLDVDSDQYYYHNAVTKETVWDRPGTGDIIPLTELQV